MGESSWKEKESEIKIVHLEALNIKFYDKVQNVFAMWSIEDKSSNFPLEE